MSTVSFFPRNIPLDFTARGMFSFLGFLVMYFYVRLKLIWVYCWASLIESSCFIKLSNLYTREQSLHRQWFIVFVASRFLNEINSWYHPSTHWAIREKTQQIGFVSVNSDFIYRLGCEIRDLLFCNGQSNFLSWCRLWQRDWIMQTV